MKKKEYIEREAALRVLCDACGNAACPKGLIPRCSYYEKMQSIPAADVRPVVLCRDCKYNEREVTDLLGNNAIQCITGLTHRRDWFCADGKKREES